MRDRDALRDGQHGFFEIRFGVGDVARVRGGDAVDAAIYCSVPSLSMTNICGVVFAPYRCPSVPDGSSNTAVGKAPRDWVSASAAGPFT